MDRVDDQIDVTTRAFLGLTIACARCHDHKYDPVTDARLLRPGRHLLQHADALRAGHSAGQGPGGYVDAERLVRLPGRDGVTRDELMPGVHSMSDFREEWTRVRDDARYTTDPDVAMGVLDGERA